ncbi:MAG: methyl-accepting chemotaxis protein [Verrucomicrobiota bacterium]|nr:methyl-accepting chemotaxis protein [Verrucomicrobiota bacterium]
MAVTERDTFSKTRRILSRKLDEQTLHQQLARMMKGQWDLTLDFSPDQEVNSAELTPLLHRLFRNLESTIINSSSISISIASSAPRFEELAHSLARNAQAQAKHAEVVANSASGLNEASNDLKKVVEVIEKIADMTKFLSVNASVEAARSGSHGKAFAVVAEQMAELSAQTRNEAARITDLLASINDRIDKTVQAVGTVSTIESATAPTLLQLSCSQASQALQIETLAIDLRSSSDDLVRSFGVFRTRAHRKAEELMQHLLGSPVLPTMNRSAQERFMQDFLAENSLFELLYITDVYGRQTTANIGQPEFKTAYESNGYGNDWSARPWFRGARDTGEVYISDIYRSKASGQFCFTVSSPIRSQMGDIVGIIGADVNYEEILKL